MKYDINKDLSPRETQLALKGLITCYSGEVRLFHDKDSYGYKVERLKLRLCERAREMRIERYFDMETGDRADLCPVCGEYLEEEWSFCPACGQALNWEDD